MGRASPARLSISWHLSPQIKWFVVGEKGQTYMKELIEEEKRKIQGKQDRSMVWRSWVEKAQKPVEKMMPQRNCL